MIARLAGCLALWLMPALAWAHVGSPNVFYEGLAGPYHVKVIVRPPGVVPGLAEISVRVMNGDVQRVTALPVRWDAGTKGAPPPDEAARVRGETNLFDAQLWLMTSGAFSVFVDVEGAQGRGTTIVPLNSVATQRLQMPRLMGTVLLAFGAFLVVALIAIVGAATRESVLLPGLTPDRRQRRRARLIMAIALLLLSIGLYGGQKWWSAVDSDYRNNKIFKADLINASVQLEGAQRILRLERTEQRWGRHPLIPDHGKLMHLFLIREPDMAAFAHLHPVPTGSNIFATVVPPLPAGEYHVFADITLESGFTQTLTSKIRLPESTEPASSSPSPLAPDPDDSWHVGKRIDERIAIRERSPQNEQISQLDDGYVMRWIQPQRINPNQEVTLNFRTLAPDGQPAKLENYMGMQAHAAIQRDDGAVFMHLHPFGNISMAAQQLFVKGEQRAAPNRKTLEIVCGLPPKDDLISFPYEFPRPGRYRLWVQVKIRGRIMTGVFDADVAEPERPGRT